MAAVWITEIKNFSRFGFTLYQNDGTWHPIVNGQQYLQDVPIGLPPRRDDPITIPSPAPWWPPITIPPGPTVLNCQYFFVGWTDFARTRIQGPDGILDAMVGPAGLADEGNDFLRVFDSQENEVASVEMGPRGPGWVASLDLHLNIDDDKVRWVIWNANGVGANVLQRADELFTQVANALITRLVGSA
jgi:hypothetical protein